MRENIQKKYSNSSIIKTHFLSSLLKKIFKKNIQIFRINFQIISGKYWEK